MRNSANSRPSSWPRKSRGKPSNRPRWSTRRICGYAKANRRTNLPTADIFSRRRPRRILIDRARSKQSRKHGGDLQRIPLEEANLPETVDDAKDDDLLALDKALQQLETVEPAKAQLVKLRYYAGLSQTEAAEVMGISPRTARRYWLFARAWLFKQMQGE
jgi:RNA polymerase sigma factor (sigma-70 family)